MKDPSYPLQVVWLLLPQSNSSLKGFVVFEYQEQQSVVELLCELPYTHSSDLAQKQWPGANSGDRRSLTEMKKFAFCLFLLKESYQQ